MKQAFQTRPASRAWLAWLLAQILALATGCDGANTAPEEQACVPNCSECGVPDGCGGTCCPGKVQDPDGNWVDPNECTATCASEAASCGQVCGKDCGQCSDGQACVAGACACQPVCDGTRCDDGCGGLCACEDGDVCALDGRCVAPSECSDTCASLGYACGEVCGQSCGTCEQGKTCGLGSCLTPTNCLSCVLALSVLDQAAVAHAADELVLAVDFEPPEGMALPRMAELRLRIEGPATLVEAKSGDALTKAGKELYQDPYTHQAFKLAADGSYRLLAYGAANADDIVKGRLAQLRLRVHGKEKVSVSLVRREQTFAPAAADAQLQGTSYDLPLLVKP